MWKRASGGDKIDVRGVGQRDKGPEGGGGESSPHRERGRARVARPAWFSLVHFLGTHRYRARQHPSTSKQNGDRNGACCGGGGSLFWRGSGFHRKISLSLHKKHPSLSHSLHSTVASHTTPHTSVVIHKLAAVGPARLAKRADLLLAHVFPRLLKRLAVEGAQLFQVLCGVGGVEWWGVGVGEWTASGSDERSTVVARCERKKRARWPCPRDPAPPLPTVSGRRPSVDSPSSFLSRLV